MLTHAAWMGFALTATAVAAQGPSLDLAPMPRPVPRAAAVTMPVLRRELDQLRTDRQAAEAAKAAVTQDAAGSTDGEATRLRRRIAELLGKLTAPPSRTPSAPPPPRPADGPKLRFEDMPPPTPPPTEMPAAGPPGTSVPEVRLDLKAGQAVDWMGLAYASFQSGNYEEALKAYRQAARTAKGNERVTVQYMTATCLRKLGKTDEAAATYREVAGARSDVFLADCARWQLSAMAWRHDLARQREELRKRREAEGPKP